MFFFLGCHLFLDVSNGGDISEKATSKIQLCSLMHDKMSGTYVYVPLEVLNLQLVLREPSMQPVIFVPQATSHSESRLTRTEAPEQVVPPLSPFPTARSSPPRRTPRRTRGTT